MSYLFSTFAERVRTLTRTKKRTRRPAEIHSENAHTKYAVPYVMNPCAYLAHR